MTESAMRTANCRRLVDLGEPRPVEVMWFPNGTAAVFNQYEQQMPEFQVGDHEGTIAALEAAGVDWRKLRHRGGPRRRRRDAGPRRW